MPHPLPLLFAAITLTLVIPPSSGFAQDTPDPPVDEAADWLEYYYQKPTPEQFVARMRAYSQDGTLASEQARPALIGFISQVIRQNRDQIDDWYTQLAGLPPEEKQILHTAMLFSRTSEADAILEREFGQRFREQKQETPKILELQLDKTHTLDMLWGFFYATGSDSAIRRIIAYFNLENLPEKPKGTDIPEGYKPLYTEMSEAAAWTLVANGSRHPEVKELCEDLYEKEAALTDTERQYLFENVLVELDPAKYRLQ